MKPKFNIGDRVKFLKDKDNLAGEVLSFSYVPELETFRYVISSKIANMQTNEMDEGVKNCLEEELVEEGVEPLLDEVVEVENE